MKKAVKSGMWRKRRDWYWRNRRGDVINMARSEGSINRKMAHGGRRRYSDLPAWSDRRGTENGNSGVKSGRHNKAARRGQCACWARVGETEQQPVYERKRNSRASMKHRPDEERA
jgi:hypothetical protein